MAQALADRDLDAAQAAGLDAAHRKLLEFVETCTLHPWKVTDEQVEGLRQAGFSDEQIVETALNVAMFLALTVMADVYGLEDSGFHLTEIDPDVTAEADTVIREDFSRWVEEGP